MCVDQVTAVSTALLMCRSWSVIEAQRASDVMAAPGRFSCTLALVSKGTPSSTFRISAAQSLNDCEVLVANESSV